MVSGLLHTAYSTIELRLRLLPDGNAQAEPTKSRPAGFARAFRGLKADDSLVRVPLIFSVCKQAQSAACAGALSAARGKEVPAALTRRYEQRVSAETLFEAVRALSLTWPGRIGLESDREIAAANGKYALLLTALSDEDNDDRIANAMADYAESCSLALFGAGGGLPEDAEAFGAWAGRRKSAPARLFDCMLNREWAALGSAELEFLEDAPLAPILKRLTGEDGEAFAAEPGLGERSAETGALARNRRHRPVTSVLSEVGPGLMGRMAARLAEAGRLIEGCLRGEPEIMEGQPAVRAMTVDGWGIGIVHSARGMLIHAIRLDAGMVADYRILAPTEWNFGAGGGVIRALESLGRNVGFRGAGDQERLASLVAGAYDPCVPCDIVVERAEAAHA